VIPVGRFDPDLRVWVLTWPWRVQVDGDVWTIGAGFISDGASIPRFLWPVVGPQFDPRTFTAAFLHDVLYAVQLTSRAYADERFYEDLRRVGIRRTKAWAYWAAVRAFGWAAWRSKSPGEIAWARDLILVEA